MLRARLLVAAIGLPLLALAIALPEPVFAVAISLLLAAAAAELFIAAAGTRPVWQPLSAAAATALVALWMRQAAGSFPLWTLLPLPAIALYGLLRPGPGPRRLREAWWLGAVVYIGVLGAHWLLLRGESGAGFGSDITALSISGVPGQRWLIVLLGVTFASDTGAYAVGRLIGRHPLAPRISPAKTREGAIGGFLAGAGAAVVLPIALGLDTGAVLIAAIAVTLPIAAQAGDLLESALKRRIGVKDSSGLLPGHGGLLDRMDSQLLAAPLLYWTLQWL